MFSRFAYFWTIILYFVEFNTCILPSKYHDNILYCIWNSNIYDVDQISHMQKEPREPIYLYEPGQGACVPPHGPPDMRFPPRDRGRGGSPFRGRGRGGGHGGVGYNICEFCLKV